MIETLTAHPKWEMSTKHYYGKFRFRIKLGYWQQSTKMLRSLPDWEFPKELYRRRIELQNDRNYTATFYTDKEYLVQFLLDNYPNKILAITSPISTEHATLLSNLDINTIFKKKLWYNKYDHKLEFYPTMEFKRSLFINTNQVIQERLCALRNEVAEFLAEHFQNDVITRERDIFYPSNTLYRRTSDFFNELHYRVYTNDPESIMMFKLRFHSVLAMHVTYAKTITT